MIVLLRIFLDIVRFKAGPQDLPISPALLVTTFIFAVLTHVVTDAPYSSAATIWLAAVTQASAFGAVLWVVLSIRGKSERWLQTATALFGAGSLLQLLTIPVSYMLGNQQSSISLGLPSLLLLVIAFWFLAVMSWVFRQSLEIKTGMSLLLSLGCQFVVLVIVLMVFPPQSAMP
ncbi:MAG TPA: hypothetical protein ENI62_11540 [Gammaproteobacteria bacterium]|nr:hypothetical protein [Gammaproteobacteria bacterium]